MRTSLRRALAAPLLVVATACAGPSPLAPHDGDGPAFRTDSTVYQARTVDGEYRLTVGFTFRNRADERVYLPACREVHPPELQQLRGPGWVTVHSPLILRCLDAPVVLAPGEVFRGEYRLPGGIRPADGAPPLAGTYRLVWWVYSSFSGRTPGRALPLQGRTSNEFRVVE